MNLQIFVFVKKFTNVTLCFEQEVTGRVAKIGGEGGMELDEAKKITERA